MKLRSLSYILSFGFTLPEKKDVIMTQRGLLPDGPFVYVMGFDINKYGLVVKGAKYENSVREFLQKPENANLFSFEQYVSDPQNQKKYFVPGVSWHIKPLEKITTQGKYSRFLRNFATKLANHLGVPFEEVKRSIAKPPKSYFFGRKPGLSIPKVNNDFGMHSVG